jgi:hypothetical protein
MRLLGSATVGLLAWLLLAPLPAEAGSRYGAKIDQLPEGVGCYWHRGQLFCSRYCYWEIDGYRYCQRRVRDAISQAPPLLLFDFEPRQYDRIRRGPIVLDEPVNGSRSRYRPVK